jgi:uncharacterized protein with HEPN domain
LTADRAAILADLMRRECETALSFVDGVDRAAFLADVLLQHAVAMCLVTVGEYATKLAQSAPDFVERRPDVPWTSIVGMRNRIAHGYYDLDFEVVWDTLQTSIPELIARLSRAPD